MSDRRRRRVAPVRPYEPRPGDPLRRSIPAPGETACDCGSPGIAKIDDKGVLIYHFGRPWPCRYRGRFDTLLTVPDPGRQLAWSQMAPGVICSRCMHRRDQHDGTNVLDGPTWCQYCTCPGPFAVAPINLETP